MKTIVEIEWHGKEAVLDKKDITGALYQYFDSCSFTVRELPAQPEQGSGCRNSGNPRCSSCQYCPPVTVDGSNYNYTPEMRDGEQIGVVPVLKQPAAPTVENITQSPMNGTAFEKQIGFEMHKATGNPIVECIWKCPACETINVESNLSCIRCGNTRTPTPCPSCAELPDDEVERCTSCENLVETYNALYADYEKLKAENAELKATLDTVRKTLERALTIAEKEQRAKGDK